MQVVQKPSRPTRKRRRKRKSYSRYRRKLMRRAGVKRANIAQVMQRQSRLKRRWKT